MQVSPNDAVGQLLAGSTFHANGSSGGGVLSQLPPAPPAAADILSPHYSALLEASRTKMRQRVPDSDVSGHGMVLLC